MNCYSPRLIPNPRYQILNTEVLRSYASDCYAPKYNDSRIEVLYTSPYLYAPCRKCPACLSRRSSEWRGRLVREFEYQRLIGKKTAFVTLTYDNISHKVAKERYKKDVAEFFDRMRSKLRYSVRHFVISELGEKKGRFHLHALLFGVDDRFAPDSHLRRSACGALHGSNQLLKERWTHGIVDVGFVKSAKACSYVSGYVSKCAPSNDGEVYVSPILSSNGLGMQDVSPTEVKRVISAIRNNVLPTYNVCGRDYSYPYYFVKKYLSYHDRLLLAMLSGENSSALGGHFVVDDFRYNDYRQFVNHVSMRNIGVKRYKVEQPTPYYGTLSPNGSDYGYDPAPWELLGISYYDYVLF